MGQDTPDEVTIGAVVVSHESAAVLPACLAALARNGISAVVVDNASRDGSAESARAAGAHVVVNGRNEGYGRAANAGFAASGAAHHLVLNPDIVLEDGAGGALRAAVIRYPDYGLMAPRLIEPDGRLFYQPRSLLSPPHLNRAGSAETPAGDCCAPFLSGACLLVRREVVDRLGGFDPSIFLFYEDDDLCRRVSDTGLALIHVHDAVARHARGGSSAPGPGRVVRSRWHQAWSRAYVSRKFGLPDPTLRMAALNAAKTGLAALTLRRSLVERYAGSAAGAWAFRRGRTALAREGLPEEDRP